MLEDNLIEDDYEESEDDVKEVFESYEYEGPWQFKYRGIDPTVLIEDVEEKKNLWQAIWNIAETSLETWACAESLEPDLFL